jgi:hypothetical protein
MLDKVIGRLLGRTRHVEQEMKPIKFQKKADGSVDTTPRILLVFPVFSHVFPAAFQAFAACLLHASRHCTDYKFDLLVQERSLLHTAMNNAAAECIQNPWYAGMIVFDDDCLPPAHLVERMVAHYEHGHHIVAGVGYMRGYPHTTTVGRFYKEGTAIVGQEQRGFEWLDNLPVAEADEHGLIRVDFCGMPAMFISRQCLYALDTPHFAHEDKTGAVMTHDIYFCNKARDKGFTVEVDVTLECAHIGPAPLITKHTRDAARAAVEHHGTHDQATERHG